LNRDLVEPHEFDIPDIEVQLKELEPIKKLKAMRKKLSLAIDKIDKILDKSVTYD